MRWCSIKTAAGYLGAVIIQDRLITFHELNALTGASFPEQLLDVIQLSDIVALERAIMRAAERGDFRERNDSIRFCAPFYSPPKIIGIGLNYREHAVDLGAQAPTEPTSFMKPRTAIIGPGDTIVLPVESERVTAEAELGIIIGKRCKRVSEENVDSVIFGYVPVLDMTAEDILQRNPRFLTRAKSFDTFFSFGPIILTPDEIKDLPNLTINTVLNGKSVKSNQVRNMMFSPRQIVSFFSNVLTFEPGDIISTGTPGAAPIKNGDVVECRIDGFPSLSNPVGESE